MTVATTLFRLQKLDSDLEQRESAVTDIRRRLRRNPQLEALDARLTRLRSEEATASAEQRALEVELAEIESKVGRNSQRIYGGTIVDPRELGSLAREIEHLNARRSPLEERLLTVMEVAEGLQNEIRELTRQVDDLRSQLESGRPDLIREGRELLRTVEELRASREPLASELEPQVRAMYDRLRASLGQAVVRVNGDVCGMCRVVLPPKDIQHVRAGQVVNCSNCGRILVTGS